MVQTHSPLHPPLDRSTSTHGDERSRRTSRHAALHALHKDLARAEQHVHDLLHLRSKRA